MLKFLLDTDHFTLLEFGHPQLIAKLARQPAGTVGISPITVEESLRGRLGALSKIPDGVKRIIRYQRLVGFWLNSQLRIIQTIRKTNFTNYDLFV